MRPLAVTLPAPSPLAAPPRPASPGAASSTGPELRSTRTTLGGRGHNVTFMGNVLVPPGSDRSQAF